MHSQTSTVSRVAKPLPAKLFPTGSFTIIRSVVGMEEIQKEWRALISSEVSPFQTFSWNLAWYRNFSDSYDEVVIFIASEGLAIFPMYRKGNSLRLAGDITCDYQDAIAKNIHSVRKGFQELLAWSFNKGYDLNFQKLSSRGYLYRVINEMSGIRTHFKALEKAVGPCPYFEIGETSDTRLAHLPRKFRAELRRKKRRMMDAFPGTELQFNKTPEIERRNVLDMVSFHSDNFRFSGKNPLDDPRLRDFLLEIRDKPEVGLCVSRLGDQDTTLAMDLIFLRGSRLYGYLTAFNCDEARHSPGSCLLTDRLDLLVEQENIKVIDFLCGSERYKYSYSTDEYFVKSIRLVPRTFAGAFKFTQLQAAYSIRCIGKKILKALRLR